MMMMVVIVRWMIMMMMGRMGCRGEIVETERRRMETVTVSIPMRTMHGTVRHWGVRDILSGNHV